MMMHIMLVRQANLLHQQPEDVEHLRRLEDNLLHQQQEDVEHLRRLEDNLPCLQDVSLLHHRPDQLKSS